MLKHKKFGVFAKTGMGVTIFAVAFFAAFLSSSHFMPVGVSSAETNGAYYANITSSGAVNINIDATPDGYGKVGKDELTIDTNATAGYKLYLSTASGAAGNGLYLSGDPTTAITATTGTLSEPSKLATNTWGFAPSRLNDSATPATYTDADADAQTGSAVFAGVPVYGSEDIIYTNTSPSTAGTNSVDVYYGVNASTALPSGTYSNTVVYTAIVDAVNPSSEDITLSPVSQDGLAAGTPITISTGLYPGFAASNLGNITVTIGGNNCTSVTPSIDATAGNLVITCNSPAGANYGSVDVVVTIEKYNKVYTLAGGYEYKNSAMQSFTCDQLPNVGDTTVLTDLRDNNTYRVTKLADNHCWMTQDLKLDGLDENTGTDRVLTPEDSNVTANFTLLRENTGTWCETNSAACDDQSLMIKTGVENGYLYNWYAVTAGTGKYSTSSGMASSSICPRGWRLPTGGPSGEFVALDVAYGGNGSNRVDASQRDKFLASPLNFNYTGYRGGSSSTPGGRYWSRTVSNNNNVYNFSLFPENNFNPQGQSNKYYGFAVRCISAVDIDGGYMQDFTTSSPSAVAGKVVQLTDKRDNKKYAVAKLADNNWWMVDDLRLGGDSELILTSSDSNVDNDFTLPVEYTGAWCQTSSSACEDQKLMIKSGVPSGYLYNWYTVTAGTGTYASSAGNLEYNICPRGWTLPTGGPSSQFVALSVAYGGPSTNASSGYLAAVQALMTPPAPKFEFTGVIYTNGALTQPDSTSSHWSRTAASSPGGARYSFGIFSNGRFDPYDTYSGGYIGRAARCILK